MSKGCVGVQAAAGRYRVRSEAVARLQGHRTIGHKSSHLFLVTPPKEAPASPDKERRRRSDSLVGKPSRARCEAIPQTRTTELTDGTDLAKDSEPMKVSHKRLRLPGQPPAALRHA